MKRTTTTAALSVLLLASESIVGAPQGTSAPDPQTITITRSGSRPSPAGAG
jgi:hypothetical protein